MYLKSHFFDHNLNHHSSDWPASGSKYLAILPEMSRSHVYFDQRTMALWSAFRNEGVQGWEYAGNYIRTASAGGVDHRSGMRVQTAQSAPNTQLYPSLLVLVK